MNFLRISCFFILFVFVSCKPLDVKNQQYFTGVVSIVVNENDVKYIKNTFSTFVAQGLDTIPEETCGRATYFVDFDVQPSSVPPFEANLISWDRLDTSTFKYMSGNIIDSTYNNTMLSISFTLNLNHFIFITATTRKAPNDSIYSYKLLCNKDSVNNNIINMYLKASLEPKIGAISIDSITLIAFNILPFWEDQIAQGKDTIKFNLNYSNRTDSIGNPIYSSYISNPIKLPVTK